MVLVGRLTKGKPLFGFEFASRRGRAVIAVVTVPIILGVTGIAAGPSAASPATSTPVARKVPAGTTNGTLGAPRTVSLSAVQSHRPITSHVGLVRPVLRPAPRVGARPARRQEPKVLTVTTAPTSRPTAKSAAGSSLAAAGPVTGSRVELATAFPAMSEATQKLAFGADQVVQPPDTQVAANPTVIVEAVNDSLSVWSRYTTVNPPLAIADLNRFFNAPSGASFSDPRLVYDSASNHFLLTGMVFTPAGASTEYIAVSQTSDPLGLWHIYAVRAYTNIVGDQPKVGFNSKVVVISWADFNTSDQFVGQETWILDKAQLIAGTAVAHSTVGPDLTRFDIVPAVSVSPSDTEYLTYNNSCGDLATSTSSCTATTPTIGLVSITGSPASPGGIAWHEDDLATTPTAAPPSVAGLPLAAGVLTGDDRLLSTTYAYGNVLTTGGDACTPSGDNALRACARVIRIAVDGATPATTMDAAVGESFDYIAYPAAAMDPAGNIFIAASHMAGSDPAAEVLSIEAGTNFVSYRSLWGGANLVLRTGDRWGDYSSAAVDPANPYDILVGVEYVGRPTTLTWATVIGIATLAAPVITHVTPSSGPLLPGGSVTITGHDLALQGSLIQNTVTFGGGPPLLAGTTSQDSLVVQVPAHAAGPVDVQVTNDNGASALTPADVFTYRHSTALVTRDAHGYLSLYPGTGTGSFSNRRILGTGWISFTAILGPGDFDGDGHVDLIARTATGGLSLYKGNGLGVFTGPRAIGTGWQVFTSIITPGDFDGDGHADLIGVRSTGALMLYPGNGTGGFRSARTIGSGWQVFTAIIGAGDFDGDGHPDLIARRSTGALLIYPGNGTGTFLSARTIGSGWQAFTAIVGPGDFDGDGHPDLIARRSTGALSLYPGNGTGAFLPARSIGTGWQAFTSIVGVGDPSL